MSRKEETNILGVRLDDLEPGKIYALKLGKRLTDPDEDCLGYTGVFQRILSSAEMRQITEQAGDPVSLPEMKFLHFINPAQRNHPSYFGVDRILAIKYIPSVAPAPRRRKTDEEREQDERERGM